MDPKQFRQLDIPLLWESQSIFPGNWQNGPLSMAWLALTTHTFCFAARASCLVPEPSPLPGSYSCNVASERTYFHPTYSSGQVRVAVETSTSGFHKEKKFFKISGKSVGRAGRHELSASPRRTSN